MTNVTYRNLTMVNVQYPLVFYSYYDLDGTPGSTSGTNQVTAAKAQLDNATPPDALNSPTLPTWTNITLSNVTATRGTAALGYNTVWGLPNAPFTGVTFDHVVLSGYSGTELFNVQNVQMINGTDLGPLLLYNAQVVSAVPRSNAITAGKTATFLAQTVATAASGGAVTPTYQWSLNGQPLSDGTRPDGSSLSGSQAGLIVIRGAKAAEAGSYSVAISDALDGYTTALAPGGNAAVRHAGGGYLDRRVSAGRRPGCSTCRPAGVSGTGAGRTHRRFHGAVRSECAD